MSKTVMATQGEVDALADEAGKAVGDLQRNLEALQRRVDALEHKEADDLRRRVAALEQKSGG